MKRIIFFMTVLLATTFIGCSDDDDNNGGNNQSATEKALKNSRKKALESITQTKEFKGKKETDYINFTSEKGTKFSVYVGYLKDEEGKQVTGDITLKFIEIYDRATMVVTNKATMGIKGDTLRQLSSGGEFYIQLMQNDKKLSLTEKGFFNLSVPKSLTNDAKPQDMTAWYLASADISSTFDPIAPKGGKENPAGDMVWEQRGPCEGWEGEPVPDSMAVAAAPEHYYLTFCKELNFGWYNIDRFWNSINNPTPVDVKVEVPTGFEGKKANIYLAVQGENNTLAQAFAEKDNSRIFSTSKGMIAKGIKLHVIMVSVNSGDNKWTYAVKSIDVTEDPVQNVTIADGDLKTAATTEEMLKVIKKLP